MLLPLNFVTNDTDFPIMNNGFFYRPTTSFVDHKPPHLSASYIMKLLRSNSTIKTTTTQEILGENIYIRILQLDKKSYSDYIVTCTKNF